MKRMLAITLAGLLMVSLASLVHADVYSDAGFIKKIPMKPKYTEAVEHHGTVETLTYTCHSYALEAIASGSFEICENAQGDTVLPDVPEGLLPEAGTDILVDKEMLVYLPYGYDGTQSMNVLYLMHGGGENEKYWLSEERMGKGTLALLDKMVDNGEMAPTIIVCPTFYSFEGDGENYVFASGAWPMYFWEELRNDIIPLVETTYNTYAGGDVSEESLKASRDHRAFAGFSMGSATSINSAFMHGLDIMSYIGSYSGSLTSVEKFEEQLNSDEYKDLDIAFWYNGSGSADMAHDEHQLFCETVTADLSDRFTDGENYCWVEFKGGTHAYNCWLAHLYNCLRVFFQGE